MKPKTILSTQFAAFGIYLFSTSIFSTASALGMLLLMPSFGGDSINRYMVPLQFLALTLPTIISLFLVFCARRLGALSAKFAGASDEAAWELQIGPRELLAILFAGIGVYLIITEVSVLVRVVLLIFQAKAAAHVLASEANSNLPDATELVAHGACIAGGIFLLRRCGYLASLVKHRFIDEKKHPAATTPDHRDNTPAQ